MLIDNFKKASELIIQLQKRYPEDPYLQLLQGICYLNIDGKTKDAIKPLTKAKQHYGVYSKRNDNAIEANYHLGLAYHLDHQFEQALKLFEVLKDTIPVKRENIHKQLNQQINYCNNAIALKQNPVDFRITNLGQAINSEFDEHSPIISGNEDLLLFTSNKHGVAKKSKADGLYTEDIYSTQWREGAWLPSVNAGPTINTDGYDATCSLSSDGKTMITYRNHGNGDLYVSELKDDKWSTPEKLPKPINSSYEESHASLSLDGNTIVFTSDRPDGIEGKDIYIAHKLPNDEWGKVLLLNRNVNTELNEESPFLSHDGQTLFFASEGHNSMGGFDIFKSVRDENGQWQQPINIGYPINTPGDDLFYIPTLDGQRVYFASERPGGYGRSDIYIIEFPVTDERTLAVVSGFLFTEDGLPSVNSTITVTNKKSGELIGNYKPQTNSGKYTMIIATGITYEMTISTPGMISISKEINIPYRADYKTRANASYLEPMVLKKE
ncbi:PD40 domain-containing protein [Carboxylicivirga sp. A043]|uniref:hypothetical protein n=1 Tax=Carboxylicivirga litoralis TaxID=2816963 RepID=UPI0021CB8BD9|nr:hypothetical protein [Carboxylicivirga sp. A043]MCU4157230.1 PD40 domain-containing protein [Carboxylicivirga sp. A043]